MSSVITCPSASDIARSSISSLREKAQNALPGILDGDHVGVPVAVQVFSMLMHPSVSSQVSSQALQIRSLLAPQRSVKLTLELSHDVSPRLI